MLSGKSLSHMPLGDKQKLNYFGHVIRKPVSFLEKSIIQRTTLGQR